MEVSNVRYETIGCLCGSSAPAARTVASRDEVSGLPFRYDRCPDCGLERLNPRPVAADIGRFYPTTYYAYQNQSGFGTRARRWIDRLAHRTYYGPTADRPLWVTLLWPVLAVALLPIRRWHVLAFPQPAEKRVFEIGAAAGRDLLLFRDAGWDATGCEPSRQACDVAKYRGFSLQCCPAEDAELPKDTYTCVTMNNVFEHLYDPLLVLRNVHAGLKEQGHLVLIVPNHDAWSARVIRGYWAGYDPPRHIFGYSPRTLRSLLAGHGFAISYVQHRPAFGWLWFRAAIAWLDARGVTGRKCKFLARVFSFAALPFAVLAAVFRHGDFIKIVARKQGR